MAVKWIDPKECRRELDKEVFEVVVELYRRGWKVRRQGHKFRLYCPCENREHGGRSIAVPGTSAKPVTQARRLRRNAEHCPDRHELMK